MMRRHIIYKRLLIVVMVVGVILSTRFLVEYKIASRYQLLVNNSEIVEAFLGNNTQDIQAVVERYRLEYQQIKQGEIIASTSVELPLPNIIPIQTVFASGVLMDKPSQNLAALAPLRFFKNGRLYVGATLFPAAIDLPGYIVYTRVLP